MSQVIFYHNARCSCSRGALGLLRHQGIEPEIRYYLEATPSVKELKELLSMLGIKASELVRKKEPLYKEKYQGREISEDQWIKILHEHPLLTERPIVIRGNKAIVARPPEKVLPWLKTPE